MNDAISGLEETGGRRWPGENLIAGKNSVTVWTMEPEVLCFRPASVCLSPCVSKSLRHHHEKATECFYGGGEILVQSSLLERA